MEKLAYSSNKKRKKERKKERNRAHYMHPLLTDQSMS
jgi:hypothetical protein